MNYVLVIIVLKNYGILPQVNLFLKIMIIVVQIISDVLHCHQQSICLNKK